MFSQLPPIDMFTVCILASFLIRAGDALSLDITIFTEDLCIEKIEDFQKYQKKSIRLELLVLTGIIFEANSSHAIAAIV